jgi:hypothetical protein
MPRSYAPDNDAVEFTASGERSCRLVRELERNTHVRKELTVTLDEAGSGVTVTHRVTNLGAWRVELGAWGLTIMRGGGTAVIPQEPYGPHPQNLLPARPLVLWPYTDMSDPRLHFGRRFVRLRSDESNEEPHEAGPREQGRLGGLRERGHALRQALRVRGGRELSRTTAATTSSSPRGSSWRSNRSRRSRQLEPGDSLEHVERWRLFDGVNVSDDEASLEEVARLATQEGSTS